MTASFRNLRLLACVAIAVLPLTLPAAGRATAERRGGELSILQARERSNVERPPRSRYELPSGDLRVSPVELLAGRPGQRIGFTLGLDRHVSQGELDITLPRRWFDVSEGGVPTIGRPELRRSSGGRASLRRSGRAVRMTLDGARSSDSPAFEVTNVGIPAGTYRIPYRWREPGGGHSRAGVARIVLYAPSRDQEKNASNDTTEESESFLSVVPTDSDRLLGGINDNGGSHLLPAWVSGDRGQSWIKRTLPDPAGSEFVCCDPMSAADNLGNIWYGGLTCTSTSCNSSGRIVTNRVGAGGTTFAASNAQIPRRNTGLQDKPMMTIDNSPSSPAYGRLYVVWDEPAAGGVNLVVSQCDTRTLPGKFPNAAHCDSGANWTTPAEVTPSSGSYIYADVAAGPDGRVYVTWWDYSNTNAIRALVCDPASQNCASAAGWGTPQTIATLDATGGQPVPFACPILAQPGGRAAPAPSVDVDRSGGSNNSRVYVTWGDLRTGSGTTRCADGVTPLATHLSWDSFVASAAGGGLPGGPSPSPVVGTRLLSDGESAGQSNSDDWFSAIAVDQTNGQAWADFYSTRLDSTRNTTQFYDRTVTPNGSGHDLGTLTQVSASTSASDASDYSANPCCGFGNDYGDYTGIDAAEGAPFPVWTDNSTGTHDGELFTSIASVPSLQLVHSATTATDPAPGGDGDGRLEPGETIRIVEQLSNPSSVGATNVNGTLASGVPGVTVTQASSSYPDIAASGTGSNTTAFEAAIGPSVPCGSTVDFRLSLSTAQDDETAPFLTQVTCGGSNQPPTASFSVSPNPALTNQTVTFDGSASSDPDGPIADYQWDLDGNGSLETDTGTIPTASRSYPDNQSITVKLRVTDGASATNDATHILTVNNRPPTASFTVSPNPALTNEAITFDSSASSDPDGSINSRAWALDGDGVFDDGGGLTATRTHLFPGSFPVELRLTDDDGASAIASGTVVVGSAVLPPVSPADTTPPIASATFGKVYDLLRALRRGVAGPVRSNEAAGVAATATVSRRLAKRLGLISRSVVVARGRARLNSSGQAKLRLRFTSRATRRLTGASSVPLTLHLTVTDSAGNVARLTKRTLLRKRR